MTLYKCESYHVFQAYEAIQEKWYQPVKYIRKDKKEIFKFDKKYTLILYAENEEKAKEKYLNIFSIDFFNNKCYDHYELKKYFGFEVKENLESEIFISIEEYENNKNIKYLMEHMLSDDFILYCKKQLRLEN